jgi:hypothetical protein
MAGENHSTRRTARETLRVAVSEENAGWVTAMNRLPDVGEQVYCTEGAAVVGRVLGRTGDGSRLLELILPDRPRNPFFAAASNVLVSPR